MAAGITSSFSASRGGLPWSLLVRPPRSLLPRTYARDPARRPGVSGSAFFYPRGGDSGQVGNQHGSLRGDENNNLWRHVEEVRDRC